MRALLKIQDRFKQLTISNELREIEKKGRNRMEILHQLGQIILNLYNSSGLASLDWQNYVMILISFVLMFLAIKKQYEPLLLLPIAFGMLLANLPLANLASTGE